MGHGDRVAADIPDLSRHKREDKERKKAGFFWGWGGGGESASLFTYLGGDGDLAAARAYDQLFGSLSRTFSQMFSGGLRAFAGGLRALLGGAAVEGGARGAGWLGFLGLGSLRGGFFAAALLAAGALLAGLWGLLHHRHRGGDAADASYDLGGIAASVRPRSNSDSIRLRFASESAGGQLSWGKPWNEKDEPKKADQPADAAGPKDEQKPEETDWNDVMGHAQALAGPGAMGSASVLSGKGLSTTLGGNWGDNNVFAAFNSGSYGRYQPPKLSGPKRALASATKALSSFPATARRYALNGGRRVRNAFSPLAFAQLRLTNVLSGQAATTTGATSDDTTKSLASDAFAQAATSGATLPSPILAGAVPLGGPGGGAPDSPGSPGGPTPNVPALPDPGNSNIPVVPPMGPGAPDLTQPPDATPVNMTPYQNDLNQAVSDINQAAMLKIMGMLMIAIGIAMMASGWPPTVIAGAVLLGIGIMMLMQSMALGNAAKAIGDQIVQSQNGQQTQGNIVTECANQATANGTSVANCQHDQAPNMNTNISQDTDKERSATWTWDSEDGDGNNNNSSSGTSSSGQQ